MNPIQLSAGLADLPRSTTIFRQDGLRGLLLYLKADEAIPEHHTRGAISVQCLQGDVRFSTGGEACDLQAGLLLSLAAGAPHALQARQDSLLLVTIAEAGQE